MLVIVNYITPEGKKVFKCFEWTCEAEAFVKSLRGTGNEVYSVEHPFGY